MQTLVSYRLLDPGSEWRLHRQCFGNSAMADLLEEDFGLAEKDNLYRCLDKLLPHREALFQHLRQRWEGLFEVKFEVLLYDLTSTYFESDPPFGPEDKRKYGYSRDKRPDCVQVVTLRDFLARIQPLYGTAERIWVMDRGIPTEEVLADLDLLGEIAGGGIYGDLLPHSVEVEALRYAFDVWDCRS